MFKSPGPRLGLLFFWVGGVWLGFLTITFKPRRVPFLFLGYSWV